MDVPDVSRAFAPLHDLPRLPAGTRRPRASQRPELRAAIDLNDYEFNADGVELVTVVIGPGRDLDDLYGDWASSSVTPHHAAAREVWWEVATADNRRVAQAEPTAARHDRPSDFIDHHDRNFR